MATTALGFDNYYETTLSSSCGSGDTTLNINTAPTATEGFVVIEPDNTTNREIIYYTGKTASTLTGVTRGVGGTTAIAHASGSTVRSNVVAEMFEALQDGTAISDTTIKPRHLQTGAGTSWAWQSWTPTWTNLTVSSSTVTARYIQIGKTVHYRITVTLAGGNAPSGSVSYSLPVTSVSYAGTATIQALGPAALHDNGSAVYFGTTMWASTTTASITADTVSGTRIVNGGLSSTAPFTWVNGDEIYVQGTYEAA